MRDELGLGVKMASCWTLELAVLRRSVGLGQVMQSRQYILRRVEATVTAQAPRVTTGLRGLTHSSALELVMDSFLSRCALIAASPVSVTPLSSHPRPT
jgi:hypothetical protein